MSIVEKKYLIQLALYRKSGAKESVIKIGFFFGLLKINLGK